MCGELCGDDVVEVVDGGFGVGGDVDEFVGFFLLCGECLVYGVCDVLCVYEVSGLVSVSVDGVGLVGECVFDEVCDDAFFVVGVGSVDVGESECGGCDVVGVCIGAEVAFAGEFACSVG